MQYLDDTKIQTLSLMLLALIGLGSLLHITKSFMVPFVIALLFAFLLIPIADFLLKFRIPSFFHSKGDSGLPITASLNIMLSNIKTLRSISILLSK